MLSKAKHLWLTLSPKTLDEPTAPESRHRNLQPPVPPSGKADRSNPSHKSLAPRAIQPKATPPNSHAKLQGAAICNRRTNPNGKAALSPPFQTLSC